MSETIPLLNGITEKYISALEDDNLKLQQKVHDLEVALSVATEDLTAYKIKNANLESDLSGCVRLIAAQETKLNERGK